VYDILDLKLVRGIFQCQQCVGRLLTVSAGGEPKHVMTCRSTSGHEQERQSCCQAA
jgi:hypothetical protein